MSGVPRASVVVPTYGRPAAIAACVAALQRQDAAGIEIVVVDDGSPEPVAGLRAGPHPLRLIRQANAGPGAARNRGAAEARGALLCLTDDDCVPTPGWAAAMLAAWEAEGRGRVMLGGRTRNAAPGLCAAASHDMAERLSAAGDGTGAFFPSNNLALPREDFLALGGFPSGYPLAAGEDRALCRAWAAAGGRFVRVPAAALDHHHALTLRGFWRQHRNYGHGAYRYHRDALREGDAKRRGGAAFYAGLALTPLRRGPSLGAVARAGLVVLAQAATMAGYLGAARAAAHEEDARG